jgi:hypothetical protein
MKRRHSHLHPAGALEIAWDGFWHNPAIPCQIELGLVPMDSS